ncbi:unnamed protein product [Musa acuminata var. zebrina]
MSDSLVRVSRRVKWGAHWPMPRSRVYPTRPAEGARHVLDHIDGIPSNERSVRASAIDAARIDPHPEPSGGPANRHSASDRVLFIFPSRYLFAISLSPIFSLGRNLLPDWSCIRKQPDSSTTPRDAIGSEPNGALTLPGTPFQGTWARSVAEDASPGFNSDDTAAQFSSWADPGSLPHLTWGRGPWHRLAPRLRSSRPHLGSKGTTYSSHKASTTCRVRQPSTARSSANRTFRHGGPSSTFAPTP